MLKRTAKSCGPDAPTLASSSRSCVGPTGLRQDISVGDGDKQAWSPGRARRKPLKPLRAGTSGDSGVLVYSCASLPMQSAHEAAGATGIRRSPRPLLGGRFINGSGASRGEGVKVCASNDSVIPGCATWRRPGIHTPGRGYGFRARAEPVIGPRFARTRWRAPE
jgi:hypothetical protein